MRRGDPIVAVVPLGAIGFDFGTSIYAEYRLRPHVRNAAKLGSDPFVAILAFPVHPAGDAATLQTWRSRPTPSTTR